MSKYSNTIRKTKLTNYQEINMRLNKIFTTMCLASSLLPTITEAATFKTPKNFSIVILDGEKQSSIFSNTKEVELSEGQHQVVVLFKGNFRNGGNSMLVTATNPIVINIPHTNKEDNYTFSYKRISTYDDASDFVDNQQITLSNNGQPVDTQTANYFVLKSEKGFQLDRDFRAELQSLDLLYISNENSQKIKKVNKTIKDCKDSDFVNCPNQVIAPINQQIKPVENNNTSSKQHANSENTQMLNGLISIYSSADKATQEAFKKWLQQQK
ncbi:MAG: DUF2057 family protein [Succinivibrionaceae bacterium]